VSASLGVANQVAAAPLGVCAGGLDRLDDLLQCDVPCKDSIVRTDVALVAEPGPAGKACYMAVLALENTEKQAVITQGLCKTLLLITK